MSGSVPPIPPPLGSNAGKTGSPNRVDTMPTTNDTINTTTTTNVAQNVVDENLPQLLDSRGAVIKCKTAKAMWNDLILAHERPSNTRDTKIAALRLKFNALKALEGEKVNGTFTRLKCLLNDLENNGVIISQAEDSDLDVEKDLRSSSEFIADLNAEYHERDLLENQEKAFMSIAEEEPSVGKADARSSQWVEITIKKADESSSMPIPKITSDSESECETQEPLQPLPKLIRATPANSLISLADLTLNMADLTLNTFVPKKTKPTSDKVSPIYAIKKKTETKPPIVPVSQPEKKADLSAEQFLLTLMDEVKSLKEQIKVPSDNSSSVS
ncbi:hypothetical protein Tco_1134448 [Tanacetum coccineum]